MTISQISNGELPSGDAHAPPQPSPPGMPQRPTRELAHEAVHVLAADRPQFKEKLREAIDSHSDHEARRQDAVRADTRAAEARTDAQHVRALHDPARRRRLPLLVGTVLVASLLGADVPLLYWAAQPFGQSQAGTLIITLLLFAGTAGAALYLEAARSYRRGVLGAVVVAYVALFALRTEYLVVVGALGLLGAVLQAGLLTAFSAALLAMSTMVLTRTVTPEIHRAESTARRAGRRAAQARDTAQDASAGCVRHIHALTAWACAEAGGNVPSGVSFSDWHDHLGRALADRLGHPDREQTSPNPT